jgi:hypothetical protein
VGEQSGRVVAQQGPQLRLRQEAFVHEPACARNHPIHVGRIEVADIRPEHHVEVGPEPVVLRERTDDRAIIGLAAEPHSGRRQLDDVALGFHLHGCELVDVVRLAPPEHRSEQCTVDIVEPRDQLGGVLLYITAHPGQVEQLRIEHCTQCVGVAFLPMLDEIGQQRGRPRHAALLERDDCVGEAARDAAEEQCLAQRGTPTRTSRHDWPRSC